MQRFYLGLGSTARVPTKCIRIASRFEYLAQGGRIRQTLLPTFHSCLCVISTTVAEQSSIGGFAFRILGLFSREGSDENRDGSTIFGERCSTIFGERCLRSAREGSRDFEADGWGDSIQEVLEDGQEETAEAWEL